MVHRERWSVERKAEHSKQSINLMFCGNASGHYLCLMYGCAQG